MVSFFNIFKKVNYDYAAMIENIIVNMKDHFMRILKKGKITSKDVMDYLKTLNATFNQFGKKLQAKQKISILC